MERLKRGKRRRGEGPAAEPPGTGPERGKWGGGGGTEPEGRRGCHKMATYWTKREGGEISGQTAGNRAGEREAGRRRGERSQRGAGEGAGEAEEAGEPADRPPETGPKGGD